jgi:hypothetical protein
VAADHEAYAAPVTLRRGDLFGLAVLAGVVLALPALSALPDLLYSVAILLATLLGLDWRG